MTDGQPNWRLHFRSGPGDFPAADVQVSVSDRGAVWVRGEAMGRSGPLWSGPSRFELLAAGALWRENFGSWGPPHEGDLSMLRQICRAADARVPGEPGLVDRLDAHAATRARNRPGAGREVYSNSLPGLGACGSVYSTEHGSGAVTRLLFESAGPTRPLYQQNWMNYVDLYPSGAVNARRQLGPHRPLQNFSLDGRTRDAARSLLAAAVRWGSFGVETRGDPTVQMAALERSEARGFEV